MLEKWVTDLRGKGWSKTGDLVETDTKTLEDCVGIPARAGMLMIKQATNEKEEGVISSPPPLSHTYFADESNATKPTKGIRNAEEASSFATLGVQEEGKPPCGVHMHAISLLTCMCVPRRA